LASTPIAGAVAGLLTDGSTRGVAFLLGILDASKAFVDYSISVIVEAIADFFGLARIITGCGVIPLERAITAKRWLALEEVPGNVGRVTPFAHGWSIALAHGMAGAGWILAVGLAIAVVVLAIGAVFDRRLASAPLTTGFALHGPKRSAGGLAIADGSELASEALVFLAVAVIVYAVANFFLAFELRRTCIILAVGFAVAVVILVVATDLLRRRRGIGLINVRLGVYAGIRIIRIRLGIRTGVRALNIVGILPLSAGTNVVSARVNSTLFITRTAERFGANVTVELGAG